MTPVPQTAIRVLIAAVAGYAVLVLLAIAATFVATSVAGLAAGARPTTLYLSMDIAGSFIAAIAGGYITARFAPTGAIATSIALLVIVVLGMAVVSYRMMPDAQQPPAYVPLIALLGVLGIWTGAMMERAIHGATRPPG